METKIKGFQNPKPRIEGGSAAATRPLTPLSLSARLCGPVLGDSLFMRERGELQRGGGESTGRGCTKDRFCNPPASDGLSRV